VTQQLKSRPAAQPPAVPAAVRWLWLSVVVIVLDQATKAWIIAHLELYQTMLLAPFLEIMRTHNTGAAFSFLANATGWQRWMFIGLGLAVSIAVPWWLRKENPHALIAVALSLIVGGAIGNVIDRVWHGHVIDFIHFHYLSFEFPAFNIADSSITCGAILILLDVLLDVRRKARKGASPEPPAP
jgi:signal peptidase II